MNLNWPGLELVDIRQVDERLVEAEIVGSKWGAAKQNGLDKVGLGEAVCVSEGGSDDAEEMFGEGDIVVQEAAVSHLHAN
jgi:hypothetical protein